MLKLTSAVLALVAGLAATSPASAFLSADNPDSYSTVADERLVTSYQEALASAGESSTGKLHGFQMSLGERKETAGSGNDNLTIHAVQDRGVPQGSEYPTYVFTSTGTPGDLKLIYKTHAGTRLFLSDKTRSETVCLMSAEKGWSDICLVDTDGKAAPDMDGLRDDFWSDLLNWFGL